MYIVKLLLEAELELTDACEWYNKKQPGLEKIFLKEFNRCVDNIAANPFISAINFSGKYRFAVMQKFPYSIVFRVDDDVNFIIITSVFHQNRNPSKF